jgi:hypothetical protein
MAQRTTLEMDISIARQWQCPVLITAPIEDALAVAHVIADGDGNGGPTRPMVMWNGAAIVDAATGDRSAGTTSDEAVLVVPEVHTLSDAEQAALLSFYDSSDEIRRRRLIATSSVCLFDRVKQGNFNARLFYRLNGIHLVSDSYRDRANAANPCGGERLEGRPN